MHLFTIIFIKRNKSNYDIMLKGKAREHIYKGKYT